MHSVVNSEGTILVQPVRSLGCTHRSISRQEAWLSHSNGMQSGLASSRLLSMMGLRMTAFRPTDITAQ